MRHYILAHPTKGWWVYAGTLEDEEAPNHPGYMTAIFKDDEWGVSAYTRCCNEVDRRNTVRKYMRKEGRRAKL